MKRRSKWVMPAAPMRDRIALAALLALLAGIWLLCGCQSIQTIAAYDARPFPVQFNQGD